MCMHGTQARPCQADEGNKVRCISRAGGWGTGQPEGGSRQGPLVNQQESPHWAHATQGGISVLQS